MARHMQELLSLQKTAHSLSFPLHPILSLSLSSVNYCNGSAVLRGMLKGQGLAGKERGLVRNG